MALPPPAENLGPLAAEAKSQVALDETQTEAPGLSQGVAQLKTVLTCAERMNCSRAGASIQDIRLSIDRLESTQNE